MWNQIAWTVTSLLTLQAIILPSPCILIDQIDTWFEELGIPTWLIQERRMKKAAAAPKHKDLPLGWRRHRNYVGLAYYHDLLNNKWSWLLKERPLYEPLLQHSPPKTLFELRLAVFTPSQDLKSPLECLLVKVPVEHFARHRVVHSTTKWQARLAKIYERMTGKKRSEEVDVWSCGFGQILSYCWGEPSITETILINGQSCEITTNLAAAVRQLRSNSEDEPLILWIDSICINQADADEKSFQVKVMHHLYSLASMVHAWLGIVERQDLCIRFILKYLAVEQFKQADDIGIAEVKQIWNREAKISDLKLDIETYNTFAALPYWTRKWIVQEVSLARSMRVHCGRFNAKLTTPSFLPESLSRLMTRLLTQHVVSTGSHNGFPEYNKLFTEHPITVFDDEGKAFRAGASLYAMATDKRTSNQDMFKQLPQFLRDIRYSQASKPEDAVFGFLSLLNDRIKINVDYNMKQWEIYIITTSQLLTQMQSLALIYDATFQRTAEYPSWMIDYSSRASTRHTPDHFAINEDISAGSRPNFAIKAHCFLVCAALELDVITDVCKAGVDPDGSVGLLGHIHSPTWTRNRYAAWSEFFDKHDSDQKHEFQWNFLSEYGLSDDRKLPPQQERDTKQNEFEAFLKGDDAKCPGAWNRCLNLHTIFVTKSGHFGMVSGEADVEIGDVVIALASAPVPLVARHLPKRFFCHACERTFGRGMMYSCNTCNLGSFVACGDCVQRAQACRNSGHIITSYAVRNGKIVRIGGRSAKHGAPIIREDMELEYDGPCVMLQGSCYLHGKMDGEMIKTEAERLFGDRSKVDDVFEKFIII